MATPLPLEGDGLIENLFYFLWCKDDFGAGPSIYIPHTVLYKFAQPSAWYFTSLRSGKIKKKTKANLTNAHIEHEFTKKRGASDIVAYYLYFSATPGSHGIDGSSSSDSAATTIEYLDADALREFLYRREKTQNGMLQKFVLPKGTSNATIRAIWSPKICLLERRVNARNVHDKRYSVYERGVTFDGADVHSRPEPVRGAMLPSDVQLLCEQIVDHVTHVSYHKYRIARMVLHLKSDADDRLWLLWSSSLRLVNINATEAAPIRPLDIVHDAQVPAFAMQLTRQSSSPASFGIGTGAGAAASSAGQSSNTNASDTRLGVVRCMSCGQSTEQRKLLATTYKAVLDHFQRFVRFVRLQATESEQTTIPTTTTIEWPPDERLIQAAGGVGFGMLQPHHAAGKSNNNKRINQTSSLSISSSSSALHRKELVIPPVIQFLHPNFSVSDFERHRIDPLFLHKPVAVCESCCLVYSDYTTTSLEVNSIRQSHPAMLRPHCELSDAKKRLDPLDPLAIALASQHHSVDAGSSSPTTRKKLPASAWKPIASDATKLSKARLAGARSTLSTLSLAPQLPQRIDSFDELQAAHFSDLLLASSGQHSNGSMLSGSASTGALQQREETFFRELQQQKDLERGHPLHHMLESATRLAASKKQHHRSATQQQQLAALRLSGDTGSSGGMYKSRSVGALPELLEQQLLLARSGGKKLAATKSPYSIVLRLRESTALQDGGSDSSSDIAGHAGSSSSAFEQAMQQLQPEKQLAIAKAKTRAGEKKKKKKRDKKTNGKKKEKATSGSEDRDDGDNASDDKETQRRHKRFISEREQKASEAHQDFLLAALSQAQAQLEHMESLASLLPELAGQSTTKQHSDEAPDEHDDSDDSDSGDSGDDCIAVDVVLLPQDAAIDDLSGDDEEEDPSDAEEPTATAQRTTHDAIAVADDVEHTIDDDALAFEPEQLHARALRDDDYEAQIDKLGGQSHRYDGGDDDDAYKVDQNDGSEQHALVGTCDDPQHVANVVDAEQQVASVVQTSEQLDVDTDDDSHLNVRGVSDNEAHGDAVAPCKALEEELLDAAKQIDHGDDDDNAQQAIAAIQDSGSNDVLNLLGDDSAEQYAPAQHANELADAAAGTEQQDASTSKQQQHDVDFIDPSAATTGDLDDDDVDARVELQREQQAALDAYDTTEEEDVHRLVDSSNPAADSVAVADGSETDAAAAALKVVASTDDKDASERVQREELALS